jgi:hypothetical protein
MLLHGPRGYYLNDIFCCSGGFTVCDGRHAEVRRVGGGHGTDVPRSTRMHTGWGVEGFDRRTIGPTSTIMAFRQHRKLYFLCTHHGSDALHFIVLISFLDVTFPWRCGEGVVGALTLAVIIRRKPPYDGAGPLTPLD